MQTLKTKWLAACAIAGLLLVAMIALAQTGGLFDLSDFFLDAGGGNHSGGPFELQASIGEIDTGAMSGGDFSLIGGVAPIEVQPETGVQEWQLYEIGTATRENGLEFR